MVSIIDELFSPEAFAMLSFHFRERATVQEASTDALNSDEYSGSYADVDGLVDLPCSYIPARSSQQPGGFEREPNTSDRVLLQGVFHGIRAGMKLLLASGSETRFLSIDDAVVMTGGAQTILVVSPAI